MGSGQGMGDFVLAPMTKAFWDFPKPSIVAVNGLAVGGAANIALCNFHDLVICSTNARFNSAKDKPMGQQIFK